MGQARVVIENLNVVEKYRDLLQALPNGGAQVIARAIGTLKRRVPAQAKRLIGAKFNLPSQYIAHRLTCFGNESQLTLTAIGRPIGLTTFKSRQTRTGVQCEVIKGEPFEVPHAFIQQPHGQIAATGPQAYIREEAPFSAPDYVEVTATITHDLHGYPIGRISAMGVGDMLRDGDNEDQLADFAQTVLADEFARLSIVNGN